MGSDVTVSRLFPSGALECSALVMDENGAGNPWGSPFYVRRVFMGYARAEAIELFLDSLRRDRLMIVEEVEA